MSVIAKIRSIVTSILVFIALALFVLSVSSSLSANVKCTTIISKATRHEIDPKLIRGVVELADKKIISQGIYDNFSVEDIALALVQRVRNLEIKFKEKYSEATEHKAVSLQKKTDIILFFWEDDFHLIRKQGFLNQHETDRSSGAYDRPAHRLAEDNISGIKLGYNPLALRLRPKSAFLNIRDDMELASKRHPMFGKYGNIGAVLKNNVKKRSLWVSHDSLSLGANWWPKLETKLTYTGASLLPYSGTFDRGSLPCTSACEAYYEALIYGNVSLNDVDYFLVDRDYTARFLRPLGKPIYLTEPENSNGRFVFKKGKLLYKSENIVLPKLFSNNTKKTTESVSTVQETIKALTKILQIAGVHESVSAYKREIVTGDEFELTYVQTPTSDYTIYTPAKNKAKFMGQVSELQYSMQRLEYKFQDIKIKKVILATDQFLIQEGPGEEQELSEVLPAERSHILDPLMQLVSNLVSKGIYLKNLKPSYLTLDNNSHELVIRANDGFPGREGPYKAALQFKEDLPPHWSKYFDEKTTSELLKFLDDLIAQHKKSAPRGSRRS